MMRSLRVLGLGLAPAREDDVALCVRRTDGGHLAALLRHRRVLHVPCRARVVDASARFALGAAVMGIWTAVSVPASSALQRERWAGTLELLVVAPRHLGLILLPITLADLDDRPLLRRRDTDLGSRPLRDPPHDHASAVLRSRADRDRADDCVARVPDGGVLRRLAPRVGDRRGARVPDLARLRLPRARGAPPRLGTPRLLGARADLGDADDPGSGLRRRAARATAPHARARRRLPRSRRGGLRVVLDSARKRATLSLA